MTTKYQWLSEKLVLLFNDISALGYAPSKLFYVSIFTVIVFLLDYLSLWFTIQALGWQLSFMAAITIGVFIAIASSLPAAPGYIGVYQLGCVFAFQLYNVNEQNAIVYALIFQGLTFALILSMATIGLFKYGLNVITTINFINS